MNLDTIFKLAVVIEMVDNISKPLKNVGNTATESINKMNNYNNTMKNITSSGIALAAVGKEITGAVLAPVKATFETQKALGELSTVGVENLKILENAATEFSNNFVGVSKADFIFAAYDIKSGIS